MIVFTVCDHSEKLTVSLTHVSFSSFPQPTVHGDNMTNYSSSLSAPTFVTNETETDAALSIENEMEEYEDDKSSDEDDKSTNNLTKPLEEFKNDGIESDEEKASSSMDSEKESSKATAGSFDTSMMTAKSHEVAATPVVRCLPQPPNLVPSWWPKNTSAVPNVTHQVFGGYDGPLDDIDALLMQDGPATSDLGTDLLDFLNGDIFVWNNGTPV